MSDAKDKRIKELENALRGLLMSADASWAEQDGGHDWHEAEDHARDIYLKVPTPESADEGGETGRVPGEHPNCEACRAKLLRCVAENCQCPCHSVIHDPGEQEAEPNPNGGHVCECGEDLVCLRCDSEPDAEPTGERCSLSDCQIRSPSGGDRCDLADCRLRPRCSNCTGAMACEPDRCQCSCHEHTPEVGGEERVGTIDENDPGYWNCHCKSKRARRHSMKLTLACRLCNTRNPSRIKETVSE